MGRNCERGGIDESALRSLGLSNLDMDLGVESIRHADVQELRFILGPGSRRSLGNGYRKIMKLMFVWGLLRWMGYIPDFNIADNDMVVVCITQRAVANVIISLGVG